MANQAIRTLKTKGATPTLDEIICLHELGKRVENPIGDEACFCAGNPISCGNKHLWPFTIGSAMWYESACEMFSENDPVSSYLLPFALSNSRDAEYLQKLTLHKKIKKAVKSFCKSMSATQEEMDYALNSLFPSDHYAEYMAEKEKEKLDTDKPEKTGDLNEIVAILCRWFKGTTPEYWTWNESRDRALHLFMIAINQENASDEIPTAQDPVAQAIYIFTMAKNEIAIAHGVEI